MSVVLHSLNFGANLVEFTKGIFTKNIDCIIHNAFYMNYTYPKILLNIRSSGVTWNANMIFQNTMMFLEF